MALVFAPAFFVRLVGEMGPLESVGALACFVAAILFFGASIQALRRKKYGDAAWRLALAAGTAFLALEEISWGQHIFGFATPPGIAAINAQRETNLHNMQAIYFLSHPMGLLVMFVFFVVVPLLASYAPLARIFAAISLPIVPEQIAALFVY